MNNFGRYLTAKEYWDKWHVPTDGFHSLKEVEDAAKATGECCVCGSDIWKLVQTGLCFTCTTGETDASEDIELIINHTKGVKSMGTVKYPRVYISSKLHARVAKAAKKEYKTMKEMGEEVVKAGLKALKY